MAALPRLRADSTCFHLSSDEPFPGVQVQWIHHCVTCESASLPTGVVPSGHKNLSCPSSAVFSFFPCRTLLLAKLVCEGRVSHVCSLLKYGVAGRRLHLRVVLLAALCKVWQLARDDDTGFMLVEPADEDDDEPPRFCYLVFVPTCAHARLIGFGLMPIGHVQYPNRICKASIGPTEADTSLQVAGIVDLPLASWLYICYIQSCGHTPRALQAVF